MSHIIAIATYGSQRIKSKEGKLISAYKIGYTTAGLLVLLALYKDNAQNVTSRQASYHYLSILGETTVRHGYLLLSLSDAELALTEKITRNHQGRSSGCWLWQDNSWAAFPTHVSPEYRTAQSHEGPNFNPNGFRPVSPSSGKKSNATESIFAEKSEREGQKTWWWLTGNTYPHKDTLQRWGCRWSKGRRAWYFVGATLPAAIEALVEMDVLEEEPIAETENPEKDAPCSDEEAEQILGISLANSPNPALEAVEHKFSIGQLVFYIGKKSLRTEKGSQVIFGQSGRVSELHNRNPQAYVNFPWSGSVFVDEDVLSDKQPILPHKFELNQTVYTAHLLRLSEDLKLSMGTKGKVVRRYKYQKQAMNPLYAYSGDYAYDVLFEGQAIPASVFQENLTDMQQQGTVQADERFMISFGLSAQTVMQAAIQRREEIPQNYEVLDEMTDGFQFQRGQRVYTKLGSGLELQDGIVQGRYQNCKNGQGQIENAYIIINKSNQFKAFESELSPNAPKAFTVIEEILSPDLKRKIEAERQQIETAQSLAREQIGDALEEEACPCEEFGTKGWFPSPNLGGWTHCNLCNPDKLHPPEDLGKEDKPAIRVLKASENMTETELQQLETAIAASKDYQIPVDKPSQQQSKTIAIQQNYVGRLSGSVDADVHCYGYAVSEGICLYLNMGGPRSGVEAIRAKLAKGDIVNLSPWDGPSIELTAGEGQTGKYLPQLSYIPEARFMSCILLHESIHANYAGAGKSYILHVSLEQAQAQTFEHIQKLLKIPVFPEWTGYLWNAGQNAMLLRPCRGEGGLTVYSVSLDTTAWTRLITGALERNILKLPSH